MQPVLIMKADRTKKRALELCAMLMIGDGALATVGPRRHVALWMTRGSESRWNRRLTWFVRHRTATRAIGAIEFVMGVALAARQWRALRA